MSKIALKPNESGTGVFTLAAPDSNADRTLTLPDEAGKVLTDVSDIEPQVKTATNATGSAPVFACRGWVNFNGTGTVAIRASGNVSSVVRNSTGNFTINFSTAMPDANYSMVCGAGYGQTISNNNVIGHSNMFAAPTTTSCSMGVVQSNNLVNADFSTVAIFR